jgi:hypothetical protein
MLILPILAVNCHERAVKVRQILRSEIVSWFYLCFETRGIGVTPQPTH